MNETNPRRRSTRASLWLFATTLLSVALLGQACGDDYSMSGGFGATAGGVQDMSLARELIDKGLVPPAEAFVVEGMFSEHDLPLSGEPCSNVLCLRAAAGVAPTLDGEPSAWLQVGLSSTIDQATYQREAQILVMTVDVSGSMNSSYTSVEDEGYATPMELSKSMMHAIVDELDSGDQVAIVTYGSRAKTELEPTAADDPRVKDAIDALESGGSTAMEKGMRRAYDVAEDASGNGQKRLMLFTDMQPNVGATEPSEFEQIAGEGADAGIGLTVFGVGVGLGQELMTSMSHLRGGNAFTLIHSGDVPELMDDSWPWMVSPIAYDMVVEIAAAQGFTIAEGFGFPGDGVEDRTAGFDVATVFLSKRRGGLLLRVDPPEQYELADVSFDGSIAYTPPGGASRTQEISAGIDGEAVLDERGHYYAQASVGRTVSLAILVTGMRDAVESYIEGEGQAAVELMQDVLARLVEDAESLEDESLASEIPLAEALLELLQNGAEVGDPYYD